MHTLSFRRSISARVSFMGCLALLAVLGAITAAMSVLSTQRARSQIEGNLHAHVDGVAHALDAIELTSRSMVERVYPVFERQVGTTFEAAGDGTLLADGRLLNDNFGPVDDFTERTGGVATIFARQGDDFVRISTSVKKADGTRALGTVLDPAGAPFQAIRQGQTFSGRAMLFGTPYMTHYRPVKNTAGAVVGVLFIGFEVGTYEAAVEAVVRKTRFWNTGGIYLVDPRGGFDTAVLASHPTAKGRRLKDHLPGAKPLFDALATAPDNVVDSPGVLAAGADRWSVMRRSNASGMWVVAEVSDAEAMSDHWQALVVFCTGLALASLALSWALLVSMTSRVGRPLRRLTEVAEAVAAGDLTRSCEPDGDDEIGRVIGAVEAMRRSFVALLDNVRISSRTLTVTSTEIAQGNTDLSARTENAAASLQQTASSIEELTGAVRQASESAHSAAALATSASRAAHEGGDVMTHVVATMSDIESNARRVGEISAVIDGIAFQTNILALNAAVEAARAGEQGRGFAVVAAEVRNLAQRSASAAKEIKSLIAASVASVETGSALVRSAGDTMQRIVANVKEVDQLIAGISHSSVEQSTGLEQVNAAVAQLDRMTQQNASLVEQSASAARGLQEQAGQLHDCLQAYRLPTA